MLDFSKPCSRYYRLLLIVLLLAALSITGCAGNQPNQSGQSEKSNQAGWPTLDSWKLFSVGEKADDLIEVKVIRVIDGDTLQVSMNGEKERVRLIGVDTPETVHPTRGEEPYGREASNFTKEQLTDQTVRLEFDVEERDKYGRLLAYVWQDEQMFNEILLQEGYAQLATYPPNVKYVERFKTAQKEARQAGRGLWGIENNNASAAVKEQPAQGIFVGSTNSKKYHRSDCQWGQTIKPSNQIWFDSVAEARNAGYEPCASCKP